MSSTGQLKVAFLIGTFPHYDRFEAEYDSEKGACRDRVANSTASDGSFHRLPDVAAPFNLHVHSGSKVPFLGTPRAIHHCQFGCQVQLHRDTWAGWTANENRAIKGKRQLGWGPRGLGSGSRLTTTENSGKSH